MLFYFDAVLGLDRLRDLDGEELIDGEAALAEGRKISVEIVIEELRNGHRVGADWRIEVFDSERTLVGSVLFYEVLFEPSGDDHTARMMRRHLLGKGPQLQAYLRSQQTLRESQAIVANVRAVFREVKQSLDQIVG